VAQKKAYNSSRTVFSKKIMDRFKGLLTAILLPSTNLLAGLANVKENKVNLDWREREYEKMMIFLRESPA